MKCLIAIVLALAVAEATTITSQYHAQDGHHGYSYGYDNNDSEKKEDASLGRIRGEYKVTDKHGAFRSEFKYDVPQRHHEEHHNHHDGGFGFNHQHHETKPFSFHVVSYHPQQHHHHHDFHHQPNHFNLHHHHKRSLWHHNNNHQQHLSHNEIVQHYEPISHHHNHEEYHHEQPKWHGPIHVPVIKHGVPTESPELVAARKHHQHKVAEAKQHAAHSGHAHDWEDNHHHEHHNNQHQEHHQVSGHWETHVHHPEQHKWTGPIHVPVIGHHGVPTETPEVRHAKAQFHAKHAEAKQHSGHHDNYEHHHESHYEAHHGHDHHEHQKKWNGPIHVPVIDHHGVPTETPEVRHAKAHHAAKYAEVAQHSGHHNHHHEQHHEQHHNYAEKYNHHDHHEARWTGPIHKPVIVHGVPTETPEVRHAKAHFLQKHAEHKQHSGHSDSWDDEHQYAQNYHHSGEHRWTGPIHVPVIKHGVPTETPEVRHAKAHLEHKLAEARSHPEFNKNNCDDDQSYHHDSHQSHEVGWYGHH